MDAMFSMYYLMLALVGMGSAAFHGTLTMIGQQMDETSMVWTVLVWSYMLFGDSLKAKRISTPTTVVLCSYAIAFAIVHYHLQTTTGATTHTTEYMCTRLQ
jgi:dihydroceramidase